MEEGTFSTIPEGSEAVIADITVLTAETAARLPFSGTASSVSATMVFLELLGAVALLLWGLRMVSTGMTRGFGSQIRKAISRTTQNRFKAFGTGLVATMMLQSSTATVLMTVSFVASGMMATKAAIALMLGADVGTAIVAQVLSFDLRWLSPLLIFIGFVTHKSANTVSRHAMARIMIGLGLVLLSLALLREASEPMKESAVIQIILATLQGEAILALIVAAILTAAAHSSLAIVLLITSLAAAGILDMELAFILVLGANLGGCIPPYLATMGLEETEAKRIPLANLMMRGSFVVLALILMPLILPWATLFGSPAQQVINFHLGFNIILGLVFIWFIGRVGRITERFYPEQERNRRSRHLDSSLLDTPALAIDAAAREALRMAEEAYFMLGKAMEAFARKDMALIQSVSEMDEVLDDLHEEIKLYLTRIRAEEMDEAESRRYTDIMSFVINLEHAGDLIDKSMMDLARKKIQKNLHFSDEGFADIRKLHSVVRKNAAMAMKLLLVDDKAIARKLLDAKIHVRDMERQASDAHLERLRRGLAESIESSKLHLDLLRDLKRVNSHFTSIAYSVLDQAGELRTTRLRERSSRSSNSNRDRSIPPQTGA